MGFKKISEYALAALFTLVALSITISTVVYLLDYGELSSPASYLYSAGQFLFNSFHIVAFVLAIYFFTAAFLLIIERSSIVLFIELVFVSFPILLFTVGIKILFDGGGGSAPITHFAVDLFGRNGAVIISFLLSAALFLLTFYLRDIFNQAASHTKDNSLAAQHPYPSSSSSLQYDLAAPLVQINTNQHPHSPPHPKVAPAPPAHPTDQQSTATPRPIQSAPHQQQPPTAVSHHQHRPSTAVSQHQTASQYQPHSPQQVHHNHSTVNTSGTVHSNIMGGRAASTAHAGAKPHSVITKKSSFKHEDDIPAQYQHTDNRSGDTSGDNTAVGSTPTAHHSVSSSSTTAKANNRMKRKGAATAEAATAAEHRSSGDVAGATHTTNTSHSANVNANSFVPRIDRSYLSDTHDIDEDIDEDIPSLVLKDGKISVAPINNSERYLSAIPHNISNALPPSYVSTDDTPVNRFKPKDKNPTTTSPQQSSATNNTATTQHKTKQTSGNSRTPPSPPAGKSSGSIDGASGGSPSTTNRATSSATPSNPSNPSKKSTTYPVLKTTASNTAPQSGSKSNPAYQSQQNQSDNQSQQNRSDNQSQQNQSDNQSQQNRSDNQSQQSRSPYNRSTVTSHANTDTTNNTAHKPYPTTPHMVTTKSEHGASHTTHIDNVDALIDAIDNTVSPSISDNYSSTVTAVDNAFDTIPQPASDVVAVATQPATAVATLDEPVEYIEQMMPDEQEEWTASDEQVRLTVPDEHRVWSTPDGMVDQRQVPDEQAGWTVPDEQAGWTVPDEQVEQLASVEQDMQVEQAEPSVPTNHREPSTPIKADDIATDVITSTVPPMAVAPGGWSLNAYELLVHYPSSHEAEIDKQTQVVANNLMVTLAEFNIEAEIVGIRQGPVVTVYELLPAKGIKVAKISSLADNIALRLAAERVRIVAPIPGKQAIGIELPNKRRQTVGFDTIIQDPQFQDNSLTLPIGLGRGIGGDVACIDLSKTPHLLIAGSTGSGKSVCVNSIICSLMFSCSPVDVRMILIDPKIVELKVYNHIPHLLTPVITDTNRAAAALNYALTEMERRYELLDQQGVRDISGYNQIVDNEDETRANHMPYIVIIIDEFADLMHTGGKQIELTISRLAAMARAVGIHLVLATQRPSADVITGLIKANIPTRIAFMVSSKVDSRIILDISGAEQLLGRGDMLFVSSWDPNPIRIQGSLITDQEVKHIADAARQNGSPSYISEQDLLGTTEQNGAIEDNDPLYQEAVAVVRSTGKASASYLQRRLQVGYNRAARLIETMEHHGIVGPANGSKAREVLG